MILGCDAAGLDEDGNEVVVHAVVSDPAWTGDETLDPQAVAALRALPGHLRRQGRRAPAATWCRSPPRCPSRRPPACPTAWLTAYRMLFTQGDLKPGDTVLVQGAGGGVATALITLARAGGLRVLATSRDEAKRARALEIGAHEVFESGARLPGQGRRGDGDRRPGHLVALDPRRCGPAARSSSPARPPAPTLDDAELTRIFFLQLQVIGSTMGTRAELASLVERCSTPPGRGR